MNVIVEIDNINQQSSLDTRICCGQVIKLQKLLLQNNMCSKNSTDTACTQEEKVWHRKNYQIWQIVSYSPKFSLPTFTDTPKMYLEYTLTVAYSPKFYLPIAFTCTVCQNFPMYSNNYYISFEGYYALHVQYVHAHTHTHKHTHIYTYFSMLIYILQ